jgi:hypothetical protein
VREALGNPALSEARENGMTVWVYRSLIEEGRRSLLGSVPGLGVFSPRQELPARASALLLRFRDGIVSSCALLEAPAPLMTNEIAARVDAVPDLGGHAVEMTCG